MMRKVRSVRHQHDDELLSGVVPSGSGLVFVSAQQIAQRHELGNRSIEEKLLPSGCGNVRDAIVERFGKTIVSNIGNNSNIFLAHLPEPLKPTCHPHSPSIVLLKSHGGQSAKKDE
jgi:hypothetical protein